MSSPRRGRGRQDNGLDAALWSPLRDVDPRVGEHLLDLLRDAGIAAYLEPAADVAPYTRTVFLPSPPTDRLFVDRARRVEARTLVEQHADEHPRDPAPERRQIRPDLDEAAEWAAIVAAFEAEHGRLTVDAPQSAAQPAAEPVPEPIPEPVEAPAPHEPAVLDRPEEHYEPPPPPPLPVPSPAGLYALLLIAAGAMLVVAPGVLGLTLDVGLILGVAALGGGVAMLVARMRDRSVDDGDDGAVV